MFVRDWMTKAPVTIDRGATLGEAHTKFADHDFRHLPVLSGGVLNGIITLADLMSGVLHVVQSSADSTSLKEGMRAAHVCDYMNTEPIAIEADDTMEAAALLMREYKIGALPVIDGSGELVGIITETDVFGVMVDALGLASGGARMVYEFEPGDRQKQVSAMLDRLGEKGLELTSLVTYRSREGGGDKLVVRAMGRTAAMVNER